MENNRVSLPITNNFSNVYSVLSVAVGTKIAIQNQGADEVLVCIAATATSNAGYILRPFEFLIVPAGAPGCFVKSLDNPVGLISAQLGGWNMPNVPIDERVYTGLKAFTVQSFVESNSKNGTQYEYTVSNNAVAAGTNFDIIMTTGSKPVLIKNRQVSFTGAEVQISVFKGTVFTAGNTVNIFNLNTSMVAPSVSSVKSSPTISNVGTQTGATTATYGTPDQGNRAIGTYGLTGTERVLAPNTNYLLRITNADTVACKVSAYVSFYEGELSSEN